MPTLREFSTLQEAYDEFCMHDKTAWSINAQIRHEVIDGDKVYYICKHQSNGRGQWERWVFCKNKTFCYDRQIPEWEGAIGREHG